VQRGWRRFGKMFFRPICSDCQECQSLKIDVNNYNFSKSEKRVINKNSTLRLHVQKPTVSYEHLELFNKYHQYMHTFRDWDKNQTDIKGYYNSFVYGHNDFGYEILYYDNEKLICVDLIDILDDGISSVYCYYDPEYKNLSLGKYSLYRQIILAKTLEKPWIYLGYYVKDCQSLAYKNQFKPYMVLQNRATDIQEDVWI
jgi:arginine-tRNA-protein transferase